MDLGKLIGSIAPWLGATIGGPFGAIAGKIVGSIFGTGDDTSEAKMQEAIKNATPDQLLALKKADQDFALQMQQLGFKQIADLEKIAADDRASARQREIAVKDKTPMKLGYIVVGAFIAATGLVILGYAKVESALAGTLIGYLSAKAEQVIAYYFGSSSGSKAKDETISAVATKPNGK